MLDYLIEKSLSGNKWYHKYLYPFVSLFVMWLYLVIAFNLLAIIIYKLGF